MFQRAVVLLVCGLFSVSVLAEADLAQRAETLKKRVIELNRDLLKLEEQTLTPVDTQVVVFLAVDNGVSFTLDSVELSLNEEIATRYLYSEQELGALDRGGIQRLYTGALPEGSHQLMAVFNGKVDNRYFRKAASLKFAKTSGARYLELRVKRNPANPRQPIFAIREI